MTRDFPIDFFRSSINFKILHTLAYNNQIQKMNITNLTKHMDATYSQIWKRLNDLENLGLLRKSSMIGREKIIALTPNGIKVAQLIIEIVKIIEKRS